MIEHLGVLGVQCEQVVAVTDDVEGAVATQSSREPLRAGRVHHGVSISLENERGLRDPVRLIEHLGCELECALRRADAEPLERDAGEHLVAHGPVPQRRQAAGDALLQRAWQY